MTQALSAVILRSRPLRESDVWVRFATPMGRLTAVANSALKSRKRFPSGFPMGAEVEIQIHPAKSGDMVTLQEMSIVRNPAAAERLTHLTLGAMGVALEIVDRTWPERQESQPKFDCLCRFMQVVTGTTTRPREALLIFCWEWLDCLGFMPMTSHCARCGKPHAQETDWRVLVDAGGVLCPACLHPSEHGIAMGEGWRREVAWLWITQVLDLKLHSETWWKLLWNSAEG